MLQYCCDRCRKTIDVESEKRFILKLDLQQALTVECDEDPHDRDHLIEVDQILTSEEELPESDGKEPLCFRKTFDLCERCYSQYARNPLAVEVASPVSYTPN